MTKILIPTPHYGFDPSEAAIPWKIFTEHNFEVVFATPEGKVSTGDHVMLTGKSLGVVKPLLMARKDALEAYDEMIKSEAFNHPIAYAAIREEEYDGLFLPGGHDKGVREYLESEILQKVAVDFFKRHKKVGAVCHGVVLLARSIDPQTGKSVLYDYETTALLKSQEMAGYYLTKLWLGDYYLTYPGLAVEDEVKAALRKKEQFKKGPLPILRDSRSDLKGGFVLVDRNYFSGRWPGDIYNLALVYAAAVEEKTTH